MKGRNEVKAFMKTNTQGSEIVWSQHPRTGDMIANVQEWVGGIRADLLTKHGKRVRLAGTWVFAPDLSFTILDERAATEAGIPILQGYIAIGAAWQY